MYPSPKYPTGRDEAEAFVASMKHGTLIGIAESGYPQVSLIPFVKSGDEIEIHLHQRDPTFAALRANPRCTFLVSDFLAFTPHDFVDPVDAGRATLHFRAVAYECEVAFLSTEPADVAGALSRLLAHHEPGRSYEPVEVGERYGPRLSTLATARLAVRETKAKFKVGPADTTDARLGVAAHLRERDLPGDQRAAREIEAYAVSRETAPKEG